MRTSTGLTLISAGTILLLAVHARLSFLNLRITGAVLLLTGLIGLRVPQRVYGWFRGHRTQRKNALEWAMNPPEEKRVPLDSLLGAQASPSRVSGHSG